MRVLLLEDDSSIAGFIQKGLRQAGYAVDHAETGEEGLLLLKTTGYDAAVVDIMLPGMDGLSVIEQTRLAGIQTPVVILSAKRSVDDRIAGLQRGGDDYLTKPFSFAELLARIQSLIRRNSTSGPGNELVYGQLSMNLLTREVVRGGTAIDLNQKEFALLEYMMRNSGTVLSKTMILEHIWDYQFDPQTNVVDVLVHRLRNKIDKGFEEKLIHTIRGVGYVLKKGG